MNKQIVGLFHDDGIYVALGKALAEGRGYRLLHLPSEPFELKYPIAYPYLLSWAWRLDPVFPDNVLLLKAANAILIPVIFLMSYAWFRRSCDRGGVDAVLFCCLVAANPFVFSIANCTLSDISFLTLTLAALLLLDQVNPSEPGAAKAALCALVAALAYHTRTAGIVLMLAGGLHFLIARQWRAALVYSIICGGCVFPWVLWQARHSHQEITNPLLQYYVDYPSDSLAFMRFCSNPQRAIEIVWGNFRYVIDVVDYILFLYLVPWLKVWVYPLLVWGGCLSFRRRSVFFHTFLWSYLAIILSWPWHPGRFLMPLFPVVFLFLWHGVYASAGAVGSVMRIQPVGKLVAVVSRLPLAAAALFLGIWLPSSLAGDTERTTRLWMGDEAPYGWNGYAETFAWVREHTGKDEILATAYDPMYYLYTGRKAIRPWFFRPETCFYPYGHAAPDVGPAGRVREEMKSLGVRYLIVDPLEGYAEKAGVEGLFAELLRSHPVAPKEVFVSSDGLHRVYELPPDEGVRQ